MKDIFSRLSQIGLKEVTSKVQKKHLTRAFQDKRMPQIFYSFHAGTGYVRRYWKGNKFSGGAHTYQLNPCDCVEHTYTDFKGDLKKYYSKVRVGVWNELEACIIIMQHAVQYRERPHIKRQQKEIAEQDEMRAHIFSPAAAFARAL